MYNAVPCLRRFLGLKSKVHSSRRTNLLVEQLETRDLLSLPAPSAALSLRPADNPALPVAFDVYNPPVANMSIAQAAPQLATMTPQANPDDSLAVTGFQFSTLTGGNAGQDTVFHAFGQTTASNATERDSLIQRLDGDRAVVTLDAALPANSMYLVWAINAAGPSLPFAVNKTEAWWIGPQSASAGEVVSLYGRNLTNGAATPQSWLYLQPTTGVGRWLTPTAVNPYKVDFVVPNDLVVGSYQIWAHNGHGGQYGWSSPVTLTVQAPYNFGHVVVNLADVAGPITNGMNITSALSAAIALIGGDGPGTIRLPAGTFYVSTMLYIGAGYGRGICLQGAGKNATIIKAAAGFSSQYFMTFGPLSKASGLTFDTAGATLGQGEAIVCPTMTDVAVIARGYLCVKGDGGSFAFTNCDFIGRGVFLTMPTQAIVSGCNFYGTDGTDALFYVWSGNNISFKNNTGQDFNAASSNPTDRAKGRFFVGSGIWGTQSNIYLGENRTINFSQPAGWGDQNTGETFMWEGNWGTLSSLVSSATAITARLATLTGDYVGREAVIVGGKGIGQHRTILATDFASGGGTLTLDRPWDVIPDATTRINIVTTIKRVAIYRNTLEGNGNLQQGSASSGVETFQGGMDFVVDSNTMSRFRWGINDFAYNDTSGTCAQPLFGNIYLNNIISNCAIGIRSVDCGNSYGEQATFLGHIYRNNTLSGIQITHWLITAGFSSLGKTMDLVIFEHNRAADAPVGISFYQPAQVGQIFLSLYKNTIDRGAAPASGSQPVSPQNGFVVLSRGDLFLNYLAGQNPFGPINALSPPFAWNAIYGAHHYVVSVTDLTTGQGPIQYNTTATSWTPSQALAKGHRYRWSVMAMTADAPLTNGSVPLDLAVSVPTQSTVSFATQTLVSGNSTVLTITIKDSAGNPIPGLVNSDFVLALVGGSSAGTFGPVSETATPGTYVTTFTATTSGSTATLNVTVNGVLLSGHPTMSVGGGSTFADNFSAAGANQQLLSPWVNQVGSFLVNTTTGTANAVSGLNLATVSSVSAADEMVSAVVTLAVGQVAGLVARHTGPGDLNMYHGVLSAGAGNYTAMILRNLNGEWSNLFSQTFAGSISNAALELHAVGSSLRLFLNGTIIGYVNDTVLTAPGSVGMRATAGAIMKNFFAGPISLQNSASATNFSDNFGTPGSNRQLSNYWFNKAGNYQVNANAATGFGGLNLATVNGITSANESVSANVTLTTGQIAGLVARQSGQGDQNMYHGVLIANAGYYNAQVMRNLGGTWTSLFSQNYNGSISNAVLKFDVVGSSLRLFLNGGIIGYANDSAITGSGTVGIRATTGAVVTNFNASALTSQTSASTTTFSDNFATAGANQQLSGYWHNQTGNFRVVNAAATALATVNLATVNGINSANESVSVNMTLANGQVAGLVARYAGVGDQNMYHGVIVAGNKSYTASIMRNVGGVWSTLFSQTYSGTVSRADVRFDIVGSSLKLFFKGGLVAYANDSVLTAPGTVGIRATAGAVLKTFSAAPLTLANQTLPFTDNFSTLATGGQLNSAWLNQLGNMSAAGGGGVKGIASMNLATVNGITAANVVVQADVHLSGTGQAASLLTRYQGAGDQNMYLATLTQTANNSYEAMLHVNVGGNWILLRSQKTNSGRGKLKLVVAGNNLTVAFNGANLFTVTDSSLAAAGAVGLRVSAGAKVTSFSAT